VDKSVFCDQINDTMTFRDLHGDGEIASGFSGEEYISRLLREYWIGGVVVDFNNVELRGYGLSVEVLDITCRNLLTFAPVAVLTAKENRLVSSGAFSSLIVEKAAA
jgi:hypothetical protein